MSLSTVKAEQYKNEVDVFQCRHEAGIQALRSWLYARRDRINTEWPGMAGDDLIREQGEARAIHRILKLIDDGPTIKPTP